MMNSGSSVVEQDTDTTSTATGDYVSRNKASSQRYGYITVLRNVWKDVKFDPTGINNEPRTATATRILMACIRSTLLATANK